MKLDLILQQRHVWDHRGCVAQFVIDELRDNYTEHVSVFSNRLADPPI